MTDDRGREVERKRDELLAAARRSVGDKDTASSGDGSSPSALAGLGLQFVIVILLCVYAGLWLDRKFGTAPWLVVAGAVLGAAIGFFVMYRVLMAENQKKIGKQ
jgi:F0F1-type ATP synthase assembly protein I